MLRRLLRPQQNLIPKTFIYNKGWQPHCIASQLLGGHRHHLHPTLPDIGKQRASLSTMPPQASQDDHVQDQVLRHSLENPEEFWGQQAEHLYWHKKPSTILSRGHKSLGSGVTHETWEWFPDGEISTCYNCVDRHVLAGKGDNVAIYYDSPVTKTKERYTYNQLLEDVEVLAGALREEGVKKGDVVMLYSELTPPLFAP